MIDFVNKDKFWEDSCDKQFKIVCDDTTLTNDDIVSESFKIHETLNSDKNLIFGSCESSYITFTTTYLESLQGQTITVSIILDGDEENEFVLGTYQVIEDKLAANRASREITAYDLMYQIINSDMTEWYNSQPFPMTLYALRTEFFDYFEIEQEEISLPQDSMVLIWNSNSKVLGKDIICSICEINGVFGKIGRDNVFKYISLQSIDITEITPADNSDSGDVELTITKSRYENATYSDYVCHRISQVRIKDKDGKIVAIYGDDTSNPYTIGGNILLCNQSNGVLFEVAQNIYNNIHNIWYVNCDISLLGNPCYEVGDRIKLKTTDATIYSYILEREISGIMLLKDNISVDNDEYYKEDFNGVSGNSTVGGVTDNKLAWRTYKNSYDYDISDETIKQLIIRINLVTTIKTDLLFLANVILDSESNSTEDKQYNAVIDSTSKVITLSQPKPTKLKIYYEWRDQEIEYYPIETYTDGTHTLNLIYLIKDVPANVADHFDVLMEVLEGSVHIDENNIEAYIQVQGGTDEFRWDGRLELEENIDFFEIPQDIPVLMGITDTLGVAVQEPVGAELIDSIGFFAIPQDMPEMIGMTDGITFKRYVSSMTWNDVAQYTWDVLAENFVWGDD